MARSPRLAPSEPMALEYAPPPPAYRRRVRMSLAVIVTLTAVVAGQKWLPPVWMRGRLLYLQHRCMTYEPPPGQVVADFRTPSPTAVVPADWAAFYTLLSPPGFRSSGTLFLHERHTPDGRRRLVAIDLVLPIGSVEGTWVSTECRVIVPGSVAHAPQPTIGSSPQSPTLPGREVQFLGGTADPADPTHLTFEIVGPAGRITCDGWLEDDDVVHVEARHTRPTSGHPRSAITAPGRLTPARPPAAPRHTAEP